MTYFGLKSVREDKPVALREVKINASVSGFISDVHCDLVYRNEEDVPIDVKFVFPVDDQSAVYKFEALIKGYQEKEQAQQTYTDAMSTGKGVFLPQESAPSSDVFECMVGNLPASSEVKVTLAYVAELNTEATGAIKFVFPAVRGPRYGELSENVSPASSSNAKAIPEQRSVIPSKLPYSVQFQAEFFYELGIENIQAENGDLCEVCIEIGRKKAIASLKQPWGMDEELVVYVWYQKTLHPCAVLEQGNPEADGFLQRDVIMLNMLPYIHPQYLTSGRKREYVFMVDRSGSMAGDRITAAKKALEQFLSQLPKGSFYNIVGFGSGYHFLFDRSQSVNAKNLALGKDYQTAMEADMGSTQVLPAFDFVYRNKPMKGYQRTIFLLTGGQISNSSELLNLVSKNADNTRVFTFGIGHGVSTSLLRGVARCGKGKAEFVYDDLSLLPGKVSRMMKCAGQTDPAVMTLTWDVPDGVKVRQIPDDTPTVFANERLIFYAVLETQKPLRDVPVRVKIEEKYASRQCSMEEEVRVPAHYRCSGTVHIHHLAAKAYLKHLEECDDSSDKHKELIVLLRTSANIVSKHNAFVGADKDQVDEERGNSGKRDMPQSQGAPTKKGIKRKASEDNSNLEQKGFVHKSEDKKCSVNKPRRSYRKGPKWTCKKLHKQELPIDLKFAPWIDKQFYPVRKLTTLSPSKYEAVFLDGQVSCVPSCSVLYSEDLKAGHVVGLRNHPRDSSYQMGLVLKYCADANRILCATNSGVHTYHTKHFMIPETTAKNMKEEALLSFYPVSLIDYTSAGTIGLTLTLMTSDLAELRPDGWVNETLVEFYLSYLWEQELSSEDRNGAVFFSPQFFAELASWQVRMKEQKPELVSKWMGNINLMKTSVIFFPIHCEGHWYVIEVKVTVKAKSSCNFKFYVIDSYFKDDRTEEITWLRRFIEGVCQQEGVHAKFDPHVSQPQVPVQDNDHDSGLCMVLAVKYCIKNLSSSGVTWWSPEEPQALRKKLTSVIMDMWFNKNSDMH